MKQGPIAHRPPTRVDEVTVRLRARFVEGGPGHAPMVLDPGAAAGRPARLTNSVVADEFHNHRGTLTWAVGKSECAQ